MAVRTVGASDWHRKRSVRCGGVGVSLRLLTRPAEADEAHDGPPISSDDIDAFCAVMNKPAWPHRLP